MKSKKEAEAKKEEEKRLRILRFLNKPDKCPSCGKEYDPKEFNLQIDDPFWENTDDGAQLPAMTWTCEDCGFEILMDVMPVYMQTKKGDHDENPIEAPYYWDGDTLQEEG